VSGVNHPRGTSNSNARGSAAARRARKRWLLATFDPELGEGAARCAIARDAHCLGVVTFDTITVDRYPLPGVLGGTYVQGNIRPACGPCNSRDGNDIRDSRKEPPPCLTPLTTAR
jgi:hypothetical protein